MLHTSSMFDLHLTNMLKLYWNLILLILGSNRYCTDTQYPLFFTVSKETTSLSGARDYISRDLSLALPSSFRFDALDHQLHSTLNCTNTLTMAAGVSSPDESILNAVQ